MEKGRARVEGTCRVCGRPLIQKGRGHPKEGHKKCLRAERIRRELEGIYSEMRFANPEKVRELRGDMFAMVNGPLHYRKVVFAPDDASEDEHSFVDTNGN